MSLVAVIVICLVWVAQLCKGLYRPLHNCLSSWRRSAYLGGTYHGVEVFPTGSRVRVTNYSPFRGLKGTIRAVNMIDVDLEEPFCFYLVALEGVQMKEPIWFEYNEVELVAPPLAGSQAM